MNDLSRSIGQSQWEESEPSMLLDSAHSTPAKSIQSARNQQRGGRFLFESMCASTTTKQARDQFSLEKSKDAEMQLAESSDTGLARLSLTESKLKVNTQNISPREGARKKNAKEKGSPLVIVASHKKALQNAQA